jgi:Na+/H+ antiporter NhaD/arsenite permease-like protein
MDFSQLFAITIFLAMFLFIIFGKCERHIPALAGAAAVLILLFGVVMRNGDAIADTLSLNSFAELSFWYSPLSSAETSSGVNWATILFIAGMMIMVEGMGDSGFFRWLCLRLAGAVGYRVMPLFVVFVLLSAVLSMFIDSITVILFIAAVSIELARLLQFDPVPMVLAEIFCANVGGSATMCGDPPNIIIGTSLGLSFHDFITNTGIIAMLILVVLIPFFSLLFHHHLKRSGGGVRPETLPRPQAAITSMYAFWCSVFIFLLSVVLLITHANTGLTVATIGVLAAGLTLLLTPKKAGLLLSRVDWNTILFFLGLFVVVGGLEQTGVLTMLAGGIETLSGGNAAAVICIILWASAIISALVDNIPFAATMVPVIRGLSTMPGLNLEVLAWTLSLGTDIGGNATPIGASANVVGTSISAREGHPISWGRYCKWALPATVIALAISTVCLLVMY